jgi:hypothetical protein
MDAKAARTREVLVALRALVRSLLVFPPPLLAWWTARRMRPAQRVNFVRTGRRVRPYVTTIVVVIVVVKCRERRRRRARAGHRSEGRRRLRLARAERRARPGAHGCNSCISLDEKVGSASLGCRKVVYDRRRVRRRRGRAGRLRPLDRLASWTVTGERDGRAKGGASASASSVT